MIKVFLAEDEESIRERIKRQIEWEKNGLCMVGEAGDGEMAYSRILETRPDILITDIMMPYMSGIELCELIKKEMPNIKIIIVSDSPEFVYLSQALRIGVSDYLIKPVDTGKLLNAVLEIKKEILREYEQKKKIVLYERELKEREKMIKCQFFDDMISGRYSVSEIIDKGRQLDIDLAAAAYNVMLFQFWTEEKEKVKYTEEAEQKLSSIFSRNRSVTCFDRGLEGKAILIRAKNEKHLRQEVESLVNEIVLIFQNIGRFRYYAGIGKSTTRLCSLQECYFQANKAFSNRFFTNSSRIFFGSDTKNILENEKMKMDLDSIDVRSLNRKEIEDFLKNGSKEEVKTFVEKHYQQVTEKNRDSVLFRQYILLNSNFTIIHFLKKTGRDLEYVRKFMAKTEEISANAVSEELAKIYMSKVLELAMEARDSASNNRNRELAEEGKDFIQKHYDNGELSLSTVASYVNVSPNHFSRVFRQEEGRTFVDYLTQIRLERAKEMLRYTRLKSSEIGKKLGYRDAHYFYYIFKKTVGCTPGDYRNEKHCSIR